MANDNTVYGLLCRCHPEAGFKYVGKTNDPTRRFKEHKKSASLESTVIVNKWMARHDVENIRMILIEEHIPDLYILEAETFYIRNYHGNPSWLVNMVTPVFS